MIEKYLDDLERRIDPEAEEALNAAWKSFCNGTGDAVLFSPQRQQKRPPTIEWPDISINAALEDHELMAVHQFKLCSDALADGTGKLLDVRCNYGTGILSSVFGAEMFVMDEALNSLPTTRPLGGGAAALERMLTNGVPDLHTGWGGKVFDMAGRYHEWMKPYPRIRQYVNIYHPDLQSSMDVCELLYGSGLFIDLLEKPEFIKQLLDLITQAYIAFMNAWVALVPPRDGYATHWSMMHRGSIMLRDDSAMNLSPDMVAEFIRPYDQRLLNAFGGGAIHFCGKGDHFIEVLSAMQGLHAIHLSQPEYNDLEVIFRSTVDRNIRIIGLKREAAQRALDLGRDLRKSVHCW
jgi:hypothetical protein